VAGLLDQGFATPGFQPVALPIDRCTPLPAPRKRSTVSLIKQALLYFSVAVWLQGRPQQHALQPAAMDEQLWTPRYLSAAGLHADGGAQGLTWKAWHYQDGHVMWELRRILKDIGYANQEPWQVIRDQKEMWALALERCGVPWDTSFKASRYSALSQGAASHDEKVRDEASVSTQALTCLLPFWYNYRRRRADQAVTALCAGLFFGKLLSPDTAKGIMTVAPVTYGLCGGKADEHGKCCHMRSWHEAAAAYGEAPQHILSKLLLLAWPFLDACPAILCKFKSMVKEIAPCVEAGLEEATHSDPMKADHLEGRGPKRRRYDEDFKHCVVATCLEKKRARTSAAFLKATASAAESNATGWVETDLAHAIAASRLDCRPVGAVMAIADCTRIGKPAEETLCIVVWTGHSDKCAILPPQAISFRMGDPQPCTATLEIQH
jgi:hypothetical protein